jgi:hypothetical protein
MSEQYFGHFHGVDYSNPDLAAKDREIATLQQERVGYVKSIDAHWKESIAQKREIAELKEALAQSQLDMVAALANHEACREIWAARANSPSPDPAEAMTKAGRRQFAIDFVHEGQRPPDPAEAMRALPVEEDVGESLGKLISVEEGTERLHAYAQGCAVGAEAMLARCVAIADDKADEWEEENGSYDAGRYHMCIEIRDAIAALKGNGTKCMPFVTSRGEA